MQTKETFFEKPIQFSPTRYPELFVNIIVGGCDLESGIKLDLKSMSSRYDSELKPFRNNFTSKNHGNVRAF